MGQPQVEEFRAHSALLISVIKEQAGTLWKAILEGLMNLVDAEATEASVTVTRDKVTITDNGRGFQSRDEITRCFATFGQPQDAAEQARKKYGRFRMGRGQLFAYGVNRWQSGQFRMHVDLNKAEGFKIPFELWDDEDPPYQGCHIEVDLYQQLTNVELHELEEAIRRTAKYLSVPVTLNGVQFTKPPANEKWDFETDEAYIKFRESGMLSVYNQGVLVMELGNWKLGCGGVVVCKIPPRVNFARNDIMSDCPVWKAVRSKINKESTKRNTKSTRLDDGARARLAQQIIDGELPEDKARTVKIFTDVTGKHWSMMQLRHFCRHDPICSMAPMHDSRADKLMQWKLAFIFAPETLERFEMTSVESLTELINGFYPEGPAMMAMDFDELSEGLDEHYEIVKQADWSAEERLVVGLMAEAQGWLLGRHPDSQDVRPRTIMLGNSDADGWTDGSSYICIARGFIKKTGVSLGAWVEYGHLLMHEYCHDDNTAGSHIHSPEFYRTYHDWTTQTHCLERFTETCILRLPVIAERVQRAMTKKMQRQQDRAEKAAKSAKTCQNS